MLYAERGYAMVTCLFVRPSLSLTLRYRGHIGGNFSKIFSRLIRLAFLLSAVCRPEHRGSTPKKHPQILAGLRMGYEKIGSGYTKPAISPKRLKIERTLLLTTYLNFYKVVHGLWHQNAIVRLSCIYKLLIVFDHVSYIKSNYFWQLSMTYKNLYVWCNNWTCQSCLTSEIFCSCTMCQLLVFYSYSAVCHTVFLFHRRHI